MDEPPACHIQSGPIRFLLCQQSHLLTEGFLWVRGLTLDSSQISSRLNPYCSSFYSKDVDRDKQSLDYLNTIQMGAFQNGCAKVTSSLSSKSSLQHGNTTQRDKNTHWSFFVFFCCCCTELGFGLQKLTFSC